jgi:imidazolonepropionase-like amidohydrolase
MSMKLFRDAAFADGRSPALRVGVSVLVDNNRVVWIRPSDGEEEVGSEVEVVDASGTTIVAGMVDCHSHLTLPGGAHWLDHVSDPPERLIATAEDNGRLLNAAGVRWARDVGAPAGLHPVDGVVRALNLGLREQWSERRDRPHVRAAGLFIERSDQTPEDVDQSASLVAVVRLQLDQGADLIKLYPESGFPQRLTWSAGEVEAAVEAAHVRGARVTAHASTGETAAVCVAAGVDSIEHGFVLDDSTARLMAARGTALVSTLAVFRSWTSFSRTTTIPRFTEDEGRDRILARQATAVASVRAAHRAGVLIAAGTDFGGGSTRANQLAWEVECLVDAGLEPWEALAAATWRGGIVIGDPDAGIVREGGPADFILVHGDPLSDPTALWRVWRAAWTD